jgi:hypothetical protein
VPGPGGEAWTDEDRQVALEWQAQQQATHGPCGQPLDMVLGEENDGAWVAHGLFCHACAALEKATAGARANAHDGADVDGLFYLPIYHPELRRD